VVVVVGSEGQGLGPAVRRRCDAVVRIPMHGRIESLNAAVAGSILLYEAASQRGGERSEPPAPAEPGPPAPAEPEPPAPAEPEPPAPAAEQAAAPRRRASRKPSAPAATGAEEPASDASPDGGLLP